MRFMSKNEYKSLLKKSSLKVIYNEYIHKTYKQGKDIFIFNVIESFK